MTQKGHPLLFIQHIAGEEKKYQIRRPFQTVDYYARYLKLEEHFNNKIHPKVNAGAAANDQIWLTDHGPDHIRTVIRRIGDLTFQNNCCVVSPYEAYILAVAAHLHDIGNVFGREEHEKKARSILFKLDSGLIGDDNIEKRMICDVAMAHGGRLEKEESGVPPERAMDTIGRLSHPRSIKKLAAILRFADELADDNTRTNTLDTDVMEQRSELKAASEIFHIYAQRLCPVAIDHDNRSVKLTFELLIDHLTTKYRKHGKNILLLDEILDRTMKVFREQQYCGRFMAPDVTFDQVDVEILVCEKRYSSVLGSFQYVLEQGYPYNISHMLPTTSSSPNLSAHVIARELKSVLAKHSDAEKVIDLSAIFTNIEV